MRSMINRLRDSYSCFAPPLASSGLSKSVNANVSRRGGRVDLVLPCTNLNGVETWELQRIAPLSRHGPINNVIAALRPPEELS
jgi:hypothetical protein